MNLEDVSIHAFIQKHGIKTEAGVPLDFKDHMFWFDIMSDMSPKQVWLKAAQVGGSTAAIVKKFWVMQRYKMDAIYTLPTSNDVKDFVGGKVNRIIAHNPILQSWIKDKDSVEQKRLESNVIYYRGTWTERAAIMVSSDLNIYDEEDRSKQDIVEQYASRLQHSKYQWEWHFSNPSVEGNGVSKYWAKSDQKHWFIKCDSCNLKQYLSWPENIDQEKGIFVCKKCRKEIGKEERRKGEWVAKYKGKDFSGYWISLLMAPWVTAEKIIDLHNTKSEEYFHNFVLGLPYVGGGNKVQKEDILKNLTSDINDQSGRVVIGVDTGAHIHYVVGNSQGIFFYGESDGYDDIEALLKRWPRSVAVFDQGGDLIAPRKLREKYKGRVFLCHYRQDRKTMEIIRWGEKEEDGNVLVDRNRMIELLIGEFKDKRIAINGTEADWYDYWLHWNNIYRVQEEDALGVIRRKWERSGADHWVHACFVGETMVMTEEGERQIKDIKVGERVLTRNGFEVVTFSGMIDERAEVIEATFTNGRSIVATPNHNFWTENGGWKHLQHVTKNDILVGIWNNSLTEGLISSTQENDICPPHVAGGCIEMYGNSLMDILKKVGMSIIKTIIHVIMTSATLNSWTRRNILGNTLLERCLKILSAKCAELGINQKTRGIIATALSDAGRSYTKKDTIRWRGCVSSVRNHLPPIVITGVSHVLNHVRIEETAKQKRSLLRAVYGITVEGSHEYFANGILVANSVYMRVGLSKFGQSDGPRVLTAPQGFNAPIGYEVTPDDRMAQPRGLLTLPESNKSKDWRNV